MLRNSRRAEKSPTLERYLTSWRTYGVMDVDDVRRFPIALEAAILAAVGAGRDAAAGDARLRDRAFAPCAKGCMARPGPR
ncbi:MAG: hypothetical protein ACKO3W_15000, partial [bacterium]